MRALVHAEGREHVPSAGYGGGLRDRGRSRQRLLKDPDSETSATGQTLRW